QDLRVPLHYNGISGTGEESGAALAQRLGLKDEAGLLDKLRRLPTGDIFNMRSVDYEAIVDGWVVPKQPAAVFASANQPHIPVLVGSNADEATVFGQKVKRIEEYRKYLQDDSGEFADKKLQAYPANSDVEATARFLQLQNDSFEYG